MMLDSNKLADHIKAILEENKMLKERLESADAVSPEDYEDIIKDYRKQYENMNNEIADLEAKIEALQADAVSREHHDMEIKELKHQIKDQAEMVAVVRCKDCIHWKADNEVFELGFCCVFPQKWVAETFYCADGERREE